MESQVNIEFDDLLDYFFQRPTLFITIHIISYYYSDNSHKISAFKKNLVAYSNVFCIIQATLNTEKVSTTPIGKLINALRQRGEEMGATWRKGLHLSESLWRIGTSILGQNLHEASWASIVVL